MTWADDARAAIAAGVFEEDVVNAKVQDLLATISSKDGVIADLRAQLADCQNEPPPDPPPSDGGVRYEIHDFSGHTTPSLNIMGGSNEDASKGNTTIGPGGTLRLKCDGKQGAAAMFKMPFATGYWEVECYFEPPVNAGKTTKVCLLLWPDGGGWSQTHHELDFNESGMRDISHQTIHDENGAGVHVMKQTSFMVNQYEKHAYGIRVDNNAIEYFLDGAPMTRVASASNVFIPKDNWNLHIRTIPKGSTDKTTLVVTRVKATE